MVFSKELGSTRVTSVISALFARAGEIERKIKIKQEKIIRR
jgi:hypothetical protein